MTISIEIWVGWYDKKTQLLNFIYDSEKARPYLSPSYLSSTYLSFFNTPFLKTYTIYCPTRIFTWDSYPAHMHKYTYTYVYVYMCVCICICICVFVHMCGVWVSSKYTCSAIYYVGFEGGSIEKLKIGRWKIWRWKIGPCFLTIIYKI